ncbi:MAG: hypothetical protein ABSA49_16980 [Rhizomicrobium sp.]|jgi:hypothetical protein
MTNDRTCSYDAFSGAMERWPQAGDQLFRPGRDSFLAKHKAERNYRIRRGYKQAGDILIYSALTDRCVRDSVIFPAIFNYRHYIEIALKTIIEDHGEFAGVAIGSRNHKLPELWQLFLGIATAFGNDCSDTATIAVGKCIDEFNVVDDRSTAFRYSDDLRGGTPPLPEDLDLLGLRDAMTGIENFFECADLDFTSKKESYN